jgi:hypothetical protein
MEFTKLLSEKGLKIMDASQIIKKFTLKVVIFVTIIDYPSLVIVGADQREDRL